MNSKNKLLLFFFVVIACISIDQVTKNLARQFLMNGEVHSYFNNLFVLKYAENTGAFLSMGNDFPDGVSLVVFILVPILFLIGLLIYVIVKSVEMNAIKILAFALVLAGGTGNIIDRILYDRRVTDFMIMGIERLRTGIFNFADLFVSTGAITLLIIYWREKPKTTIAPPEQVSE